MWKTASLLLLIPMAACLALQPSPKLLSPADAVLLAWQDLQSLPPASREYARYLWVGSAEQKEWEDLWRVLSGHLQALSTESDITLPVRIHGGSLIRIDGSTYGERFLKVWERLAEVDPHFHVTLTEKGKQSATTVEQIGGQATEIVVLMGADVKLLINGNPTKSTGPRRIFVPPPGSAGTFELEAAGVKTKVSVSPGTRTTVDLRQQQSSTASGDKRVRALSPALSPTSGNQVAVSGLVSEAKSQVPVLDGPWFLSHTAIQEDRGNSGYYDFLGIKNRRDYEELIGYSGKLAANAKFTELLEAVALSGVAQQPRRLQREASLGGGYWRTLDNKQSLDEHNPLRVLDKRNFKHNAEEAIGFKANGWVVWGLFVGDDPLNKAEKDGDLQKSAPDFIGYNQAGAFANDGRIHVGYGCMACHYYATPQANSALIEFDPWVRDVLEQRHGNPFALQSPDKELLRELQKQYFRPFKGPLDSDRKVHSEAVFSATGMETKAYAQAFVKAFKEYESEVDLPRAARTIGVEAQTFKRSIIDYVSNTGSVDPVLAGLARGKRIPIRQFEEVIPLAHAVSKGVVVP